MIDKTTLFEAAQTLPDSDAARRYGALIGMDQTKTRLVKVLSMLVNFAGVEEWANRHHKGGGRTILNYLRRRPPLLVLAGDVGSGKTELAETVGDAVARQEQIDITLLPLSLASRGSGRVGEMTQLVSAAFAETVDLAKRVHNATGKARGAVILLIDEADALVQSREANQMHHEDRAGVNAVIRGIDAIARQRLPAAVIMCTNRLSAIDPAVQRRAAEVFSFGRPNDSQRQAVIEAPLQELGMSAADIARITAATGPNSTRPYGFTYSDLTQRLLPTLVLDAYPSSPVTFAQAFAVVQSLEPTPPFVQGRVG